MKAAVLQKAALIEEKPLRLTEVPDPEPGPGEIRIKVRACGLCRTDLHTIEGDLPLPVLPLVPGHQVVGVVDRLGEEVSRFAPGDRVGVPWLNRTCGECRFCKWGKENLCENAKFTGYHVNGGYAQYMTVSQDFAYRIPEGFSDEEATPLLCAGVIGYRALRLSEIQPGQRLGLYGFGASAHVSIQIALHWGCEVYVFSRTREHLELALRLGAKWAGHADEDPGVRLDGSVIFAPAGPLVLDALRVLEKGGTIALAGIYMTPIPEIEYDLIYHERTLRSVANSTRQDVIDMLRAADEARVHTEIEVFPLEEANRALKMVKDSEISGAGVLSIP